MMFSLYHFYTNVYLVITHIFDKFSELESYFRIDKLLVLENTFKFSNKLLNTTRGVF